MLGGIGHNADDTLGRIIQIVTLACLGGCNAWYNTLRDDRWGVMTLVFIANCAAMRAALVRSLVWLP